MGKLLEREEAVRRPPKPPFPMSGPDAAEPPSTTGGRASLPDTSPQLLTPPREKQTPRSELPSRGTAPNHGLNESGWPTEASPAAECASGEECVPLPRRRDASDDLSRADGSDEARCPEGQAPASRCRPDQLACDRACRCDDRRNCDGRTDCANSSAAASQRPQATKVWQTEWRSSLKRNLGVGLKNLGNTCFLNCTLQVLTHQRAVLDFLDKHDGSHCDFLCVSCRLKEHIAASLSSTSFGGALEPRWFVDHLTDFLPKHRRGHQEDAAEFLQALLNQIKNPGNEDQVSVLTDVAFGGEMVCKKTCEACSTVHAYVQNFCDVSLAVTDAATIEDAMKHFFEQEILKDYQCSNCLQKGKIRKNYHFVQGTSELRVLATPAVLVAQLKRFDSEGRKLTHKVAIAETLDLRSFSSPALIGDTSYHLSGTINHLGPSVRAGHYVCCVRDVGGRMHVIDDANKGLPIMDVESRGDVYIAIYSRASKQPAHGQDDQAKTPTPASKVSLATSRMDVKPKSWRGSRRRPTR